MGISRTLNAKEKSEALKLCKALIQLDTAIKRRDNINSVVSQLKDQCEQMQEKLYFEMKDRNPNESLELSKLNILTNDHVDPKLLNYMSGLVVKL